MKKIIIIVSLILLTVGICYAGCKLDWNCYHSCAFSGDWSPSKEFKCREICTYCYEE